MAQIIDRNLSRVRRWYRDGFSAREIAIRLDVSLDAVYYFLRKHGVPRRNFSESNVARFAHAPLSFTPLFRISLRDKVLMASGLMLYWAEGTLRGHTVDFTNSQPAMVALFLKFLRKIYGVEKRRLRVLLYCYETQDQGKLMRFWSKLTQIPLCQFTKPYVKPHVRASAPSRTMPYGLVHIRYSDKKLLLSLQSEIKKHVEIMGVGSEAVKRTWL